MLPNVKCPHCGKVGCVEVTGFASELATREKYCRFCEEKFYVHLIITTSKKEEIRDGKINELKKRITYLSKERKKSLVELLIKKEFCEKVNKDSIEIARDMRAKAMCN